MLLGLAAGIIAAAALLIQFRIHLTNELEQYSRLPAHSKPVRGDSLVVFAPHCDDETLGCGGLLAVARRNNARIRVVFITNGDGYRFAVGTAYKTVRVTPARCIDFAYQRQAETLRALEVLGLDSSSIIFLGYPDRGLARMWDTNWSPDRPYVSPSTRVSRSPYRNSFSYGAAYCGESLISDIERIMESEWPSDVYIPHPCDNHSDHYATYCFVTAALKQLEQEGRIPEGRTRVHTYLVHRGDWPVPKGDHPEEPLSPPSAMTGCDTRWTSLSLEESISAAKRRAIRQYQTQTAIERGFLMSFARSNEVFGTMRDRRVATVKDSVLSVDGRPEDWHGIAPVIVDAVGDYVVAGMRKGGDVRAVYLGRDSHFVHIRLDCVGSLSRRVSYSVNFRGVNAAGLARSLTIKITPGKESRTEGIFWAWRKNVMEVAVPLESFPLHDDLFVQVLTRYAGLTVDNTGWQALSKTTPW